MPLYAAKLSKNYLWQTKVGGRLRTGIPVRQIEEKTMEKQRPKTEMVGPEGLEPPTKRL